MVTYFFEDIAKDKSITVGLKKWIKQLIISHSRKMGDINYIFCSDAYLLEINKKYLNHNYFTDIITFDNSEDDSKLSGDIFISLDTVKTNASEYKVSFFEEILRVMAHGVLHLVGFNDKNDKDQAVMTQKENEALELFHREFSELEPSA